MSDYIIKVENLGKKYRIRHQADQQRYVALRDVITNGVKGLASQVLEKGHHLFSRNGTSDAQHLTPHAPRLTPSRLQAPRSLLLAPRRSLPAVLKSEIRNSNFEISSRLPAPGSKLQADRPLTGA